VSASSATLRNAAGGATRSREASRFYAGMVALLIGAKLLAVLVLGSSAFGRALVPGLR
jgi:hypothetical protein